MSGWRLTLFRSLKSGDLPTIQRLTEEHPSCIHEPFTKEMQAWELEWDSLRWFEFLEATALYIAASYCQLEVVRWLLDNGVDRAARGYCAQTALDAVGQCAAEGGGGERRWEEARAAIEALLRLPPQPPRPPPGPRHDVRVVYENVVRRVVQRVDTVGSDKTSRMVPKRITETVARCKVMLDWSCYWLSPTTPCELQYFKNEEDDKPRGTGAAAARRAPSRGKSSGSTAATGGGGGGGGGDTGAAARRRRRRDSQWASVELKQPSRTLVGLHPGTSVEVRVRARTAGGWSDWSEVVTVVLPEVDVPREETLAERTAARAAGGGGGGGGGGEEGSLGSFAELP